VEVPSLPPIPQQPPSDTIGVSIQLQF